MDSRFCSCCRPNTKDLSHILAYWFGCHMMTEGIDSVRVDIATMLRQLSSYDPSNHKISKVPEFLRGGHEEAFDPAIVSIGPIHHNMNHVKDIEQHKVWYLQHLLDRGEHSLDDYMTALWKLEKRARDYYSSLIQLPEHDEFVEMLLLDGVFVIELARKWSESDKMENENDYIFQYGKVHCNEELIQIRRDLLMIENQLPFFILVHLFEMTKTEDSSEELHLLLLDFFRRIIPGHPEVVCREMDYGNDPDHLLGLVYKAYFVDESIDQSHNDKNFMFHEINSTSELKEAGIQFIKRAETTTLLNVKFSGGVMSIPKLEVGDVTESLFRNLIAYELIRFDEKRVHKPRYVTEYCFLMQFLINSTKDVEILRRAGIVINWMGDDETVRLLFNKLTKNVATSQDFYYANIIRSMNEYCGQPCNKWLANLNRNYFNSPWAILSVVAAAILLLMTATQTVFGVLSYTAPMHTPTLSYLLLNSLFVCCKM